VYKAQGRYAEAEPLYKRGVAIFEKSLGAHHPSVASAMDNLASVYKDEARYAEAESLYKQALAIREKALPPDHPGRTIAKKSGRSGQRPEERRGWRRITPIALRELLRKSITACTKTAGSVPPQPFFPVTLETGNDLDREDVT
jgi:tetratricopeptide (TPR) repeat protein